MFENPPSSSDVMHLVQAKVSPTVEVYAQIPKPDGVGDRSMPYAAWRCMSDLLGSSTGMSGRIC